jgi:hypothetical protein
MNDELNKKISERILQAFQESFTELEVAGRKIDTIQCFLSTAEKTISFRMADRQDASLRIAECIIHAPLVMKDVDIADHINSHLPDGMKIRPFTCGTEPVTDRDIDAVQSDIEREVPAGVVARSVAPTVSSGTWPNTSPVIERRKND